MSIASVLNGVVSTFEVGQEIYRAVVNAMDAAEAVAQSASSKKAYVLAYIKSMIQESGKNWDKWAKYISEFIDSAKALYNSVKGLFK